MEVHEAGNFPLVCFFFVLEDAFTEVVEKPPYLLISGSSSSLREVLSVSLFGSLISGFLEKHRQKRYKNLRRIFRVKATNKIALTAPCPESPIPYSYSVLISDLMCTCIYFHCICMLKIFIFIFTDPCPQ